MIEYYCWITILLKLHLFVITKTFVFQVYLSNQQNYLDKTDDLMNNQNTPTPRLWPSEQRKHHCYTGQKIMISGKFLGGGGAPV